MWKKAVVALLGVAIFLAVAASSGCGSNETVGGQPRGPGWSVPVVSTASLPDTITSAPPQTVPSAPSGGDYVEEEEESSPPVVEEPPSEPESPTTPACPT